jgi:hypothetical protein
VAVVLHWWEHAPYGPAVEYLISAPGMGEVRAECDRAELYYGTPDRKQNALGAHDPLAAVAGGNSGQLLWRLEGEDEWRVGASTAAAWRAGDISRVNDTIDAARSRRRDRRNGH